MWARNVRNCPPFMLIGCLLFSIGLVLSIRKHFQKTYHAKATIMGQINVSKPPQNLVTEMMTTTVAAVEKATTIASRQVADDDSSARWKESDDAQNYSYVKNYAVSGAENNGGEERTEHVDELAQAEREEEPSIGGLDEVGKSGETETSDLGESGEQTRANEDDVANATGESMETMNTNNSDIGVPQRIWRPNTCVPRPEQHHEEKTILLWNSVYNIKNYALSELGYEPFKRSQCPAQNCHLTEDRGKLMEADAVLFHIPSLTDMPAFRPCGQPYIFFSREVPFKTFWLAGLHGFNVSTLGFSSLFNLTMTYRVDSDIPIPFYSVFYREAPTPYVPKHSFLQRKKAVAWQVDHCETHSQSMIFAEQLAKYIDVDMYGNCGTFQCAKTGPECWEEEIPSQYKFYLAFERYYCTDYALDVFYTLRYDIVPVVFGRFNYSRDLPPGSFINAQDFASPRELAEYLKYLSSNVTEYMKYFEWKNKYVLWDPLINGFCSLCQIINDPQFYHSHDNVVRWFHGNGDCYNNAVMDLKERAGKDW